MALAESAPAPIAVFAFNRPRQLETLLHSLTACLGYAESAVTVFVDGPRQPEDTPLIKEVVEVVKTFDSANMSLRTAASNRGLRNSIHEGVTQILTHSPNVIVLEDDLILSPIALKFFNEALGHYATKPEIWSVSGYLYDTEEGRNRRATLVLPFPHPWGWATWSDRWSRFALDNHPHTEDDLNSASFRQAFDVNGMYPFTKLLRASMAGQVNSWFIHWYFTIFQQGGRTAYPPRRVVDNLGLSAGTHGSKMNPYDLLVKRPSLLTDMPTFSDNTGIEYAALDSLKKSWELRVHRGIAHAGALRRVIHGPRRN